MKLTQLFVALGFAVVLFSCKKDDKKETVTPEVPEVPEVPVVPDSIYLINKAYYYFGDSTASVAYTDSVYYTDNRISKIIARNSSNDSVNYSFSYNTAGKLTLVVAKGTGFYSTAYDQDYHLYYNANNQIDSIRTVDRTIWGGNVLIKMSYDDNKLLTSAIAYTVDPGEETEWTSNSFVYKRTAAGKLDTIYHGVTAGEATTSFKPATDSVIKFSDAYNMLLAIRSSYILVGSISVPKLNLHQLLNPSDYLFSNGQFFYGEFDVNYSKNGLGKLSTYWFGYFKDGAYNKHSAIHLSM